MLAQGQEVATINRVLTIKQAAEALNVSPDTIRRRIKAGEIKAEKVHGAYGMQWAINEQDLTAAAEVVEVVPVNQSLTAGELEAMLRRLMDEQTEEIKELRNEVQQLREELQQQKQLGNEGNQTTRWWKFWEK